MKAWQVEVLVSCGVLVIAAVSLLEVRAHQQLKWDSLEQERNMFRVAFEQQERVNERMQERLKECQGNTAN